jgi:hypothetical protein
MKFSLCIILLLWASNIKADDLYINKVVDAIYLAEGGTKTKHPYGVMLHCHDTKEYRQVCFNTVKHSYIKWEQIGKPGDFITELGKIYAPTSGKITSKERELNQYWVRNVSYFVRKVNK